jgi:hypothetical protein
MMDWQRLPDVLLEVFGDVVAAQGQPTWIRILGPRAGADPDDLMVAFSTQPDALLGWVATSDCDAVGVLATGRLRVLAGGPSPAEHLAGRRIRIACVVARSGAMTSKVVLPDGTAVDQAPTEGRMLDCLRRCFALPTPPPMASPSRLQTVAWLAAILERAEAARRPLNWSDVAKLHPVARVIGSDLDRSCWQPWLPGLVRAAGSAWSWESFRLQAAGGEGLRELIDPSLAGWMDEGMFARWVLDGLPSPDEMLAALRPQLSPSAARRLGHAIHAADQPVTAGTAG